MTMESKPYSPLDPLYRGVATGAVLAPLPSMVCWRELAAMAPTPPPQIVEGILHQGCKMILGGTSKSNKTWCLLDLALSVASGTEWWGHPCTRMHVVYINFELHDWAIAQRLNALERAKTQAGTEGLALGERPPESHGGGETPRLEGGHPFGERLHLWNLRGHNTDLTVLRPQLEEQLVRHQFGLIILDPAYKLLGARDENANGQIAGLMNEFEGLARSSGAAVAVAHHFAKGDSTAKYAIDRMSGAGAWARDPDSILVLTPHEEPGCFTVTSILRNLPQLPDFVLQWDYPLMKLMADLNPEALRRPQSKNKRCTDREFVGRVFNGEPRAYADIVKRAKEGLRMSEATVNRYLSRLKGAELILQSSGLYRPAHHGAPPA